MDTTVLLKELENHVDKGLPAAEVAAARERLDTVGHARVSFLAPDAVKQAVAAEVKDLLAIGGTRRELRFAETDYTPRRMRNLTRAQIAAASPIIRALYASGALLRAMSQVAGEPVHVCPYEPEQYVITCLEKDGDTHGWHWDDYTFALVWVVECPSVDDGGFVQCVPGTTWDKKSPGIHRAMVSSPIYSMELFPGDLYLMRTNTTMHRVFPVRNGTRKIINMGYASTSDLTADFSHETMDQLWATAPTGKA